MLFQVTVDFNTESLSEIFSHMSKMLHWLFPGSGAVAPFRSVGGVVQHHINQKQNRLRNIIITCFLLFVDFRSF